MAVVLVVDDLLELRLMLEDLLLEAGHTVVCAENGSEGIDRAGEQSFDLLISDIFMPEMDGLEFIRKVRQLQPRVPIIAMSAGDSKGTTDTLEYAEDFGASRIFVKPFPIGEFLEAVEELISSENE